MRAISASTASVLSAFLDNPSDEHYGYGLMVETGLKSGTLYPILRRMESFGWVVRRTEESALAGRPPRKVYTLTGEGERAMRPILAEAQARLAVRLL